MVKVNIINRNKSVDVKVGTGLVAAIRKVTFVETPCNQNGLCGRCKVKASGELSDILEREKQFINSGERLACSAKVLGDVDIEMIEENRKMKSADEGEVRDVSIKNKYERDDSYGVAVDIGTTGISAYLVDLKTGFTLSKASSVNPQTKYGEDIISRVNFSNSTGNGEDLLKNSLVNGINDLIEELMRNLVKPIKNEEIYKVTVSGSTIMLHMLFGESASKLCVPPYAPEFTWCLKLSRDMIDFNINKKGEIVLLPSASGYIGADIVAGIINCEIHKKQWKTIFIDIGTNVEIALSVNEKIYAAIVGSAFNGINTLYSSSELAEEIYSKIKMLISECKEKIEDVNEFIVAGSFGYNLKEESLNVLRIMQKEFSGRVRYVGNVSLEGARLALINDNILEEMNSIKNEIVSMELSNREGF